jgi:hypothetical protein
MLPVSLDCIFLIAPLVFSKGAIKNIQSTETGNIRYTRHRENKRQRIPKGNQKYTIQRN